MSHQIPFHRDPFTPRSIAGNEDSSTPVRFYLCSASGPDLARIKDLLYASINLTQEGNWTPEVSRNVARGFVNGGDLFIQTVEKIDHLTVPGALARKAGLLKIDDKVTDDADVPVTTGEAFARVARYTPTLAFEVAMQIAKMSESEAVDPRFTHSPTTSRGTRSVRSGSAGSVKRPRGPRVIAGKPTTPGTNGATSDR